MTGAEVVSGTGAVSAAADATDTAEWAAPERLLEPALDLVPVTGPVVLLAPGCPVGGEAIAHGAAAVAAGEIDARLCGGAGELAQEVCAMFTSLRALAPQVARPFDTDRRGMQPAEGVGVLVLGSAAHCVACGGRPLAGLLGWSSARPELATSPARSSPGRPTFIVALGGHDAVAIEVTSGRRRPQCN